MATTKNTKTAKSAKSVKSSPAGKKAESGASRIVVGVLCALLAVAVLMGSAALGWFVHKWTKGEATSQEQTQTDPDEAQKNNAIITEGESNGIELASALLPRAAYTANKVPVFTDTAYKLTATVLPEGASNQAVDWSVAFANPVSEWATGKTVTDYVTITPTSDGALEATLANLGPFGEQIVVKVVSRENTSASATCTVDYLQRVEGVTMSIGDINVNFSGNTDVKLIIGKDVGGSGGLITFETVFSEVYTVEDSYAETVSFAGGKHNEGSNSDYFAHINGASHGAMIGIQFDDPVSPVGKKMFFDRRLFTDYNFFSISGLSTKEGMAFSELSYPALGSLFESAEGKILWDIEVTLEGTYKSYTFKSPLRIGTVDKTFPVEGLETNQSGVIF